LRTKSIRESIRKNADLFSPPMTPFEPCTKSKLDRTDVICGFPAKTIRNFLGYARDGAFAHSDAVRVKDFEDDAAHYFGDSAAAVVAELTRRGWIEPGQSDGDFEHHSVPKDKPAIRLTQLGKQSRVVSLNKRFPRTEGNAIVDKLIERAKAMNANNDLLYGVSELRLFGSMLDSKAETVGDVDVAYELFRKTRPDLTWTQWNVQRAKASGRDLRYDDEISFGVREVRSLLKDRNTRLSLQGLSDFDRLVPKPRYKVIFKTKLKLSPRELATERVQRG
jgi:hypothetical protein